ncbi:DUF84 family protein [Salibacterium aidingense]|uniref:DUF84 family protein n=1 Tax=Salibacterium aidingense TaxID=384933 RepID=UPI0004229514|nr:DUF84 family protein [Salibacterium aidingense]
MSNVCGVGSGNKAKIQAVSAVFSDKGYRIYGYEVDSAVSAQPFSEEETKAGAETRAQAVVKKEADIGIGLEGGVTEMEDGLYLCNWGALADTQGNIFTAAGAKIRLPEEIAEGLRAGKELKTVMDLYTDRHDVSQNEGAVGIFTDGIISRADMFTHTVQLLYGQWRFYTT